MKNIILFLEKHFKTIIMVLMIYATIAVTMILFTSTPNTTAPKQEPVGIAFNNCWTVFIDSDLIGGNVKLPYKSDNTSYHTIDAYNIIPPTGYKCSVLSTMVYQRKFQVLVDNDVIYNWDYNDHNIENDTMGSRQVFVSIPKEYEGKTIHLHFERTVLGDDASILPVELYNVLSNYNTQITKNNYIMIVATSCAIISLLALLFSLFVYRKDFFFSPYTFLSLHILTLSLWSLCNAKYMQFFTDNALLIHNIEYICFFSTSLFMWLYIYLNWKICPRIIMAEIIILASFFVLALTLKLFKICDFFALLKAYHFMLFCTFPILIASLYVGFKSKFESLKIFYIGFLGLGVIAGFEIFRFYFAITEMERLNSFLIGIIIMISCTFLSFALSAKEKMQAQFENEIYKKLANTDQLTSIRNRLAFDTSLQRYSESNDIFNSITFAFIDVNNFKTINDTYGHAVGDTVLQKIATALDEQFSHFASCYRIGGDEFCILAINCDEETIAEYLNIVNQNLKQEITDFSVSVSYGISTCNGNDVDTLYNSFKLADHRMYQQKDQYKKNKKMKTKSHTN